MDLKTISELFSMLKVRPKITTPLKRAGGGIDGRRSQPSINKHLLAQTNSLLAATVQNQATHAGMNFARYEFRTFSLCFLSVRSAPLSIGVGTCPHKQSEFSLFDR